MCNEVYSRVERFCGLPGRNIYETVNRINYPRTISKVSAWRRTCWPQKRERDSKLFARQSEAQFRFRKCAMKLRSISMRGGGEGREERSDFIFTEVSSRLHFRLIDRTAIFSFLPLNFVHGNRWNVTFKRTRQLYGVSWNFVKVSAIIL